MCVLPFPHIPVAMIPCKIISTAYILSDISAISQEDSAPALIIGLSVRELAQVWKLDEGLSLSIGVADINLLLIHSGYFLNICAYTKPLLVAFPPFPWNQMVS